MRRRLTAIPPITMGSRKVVRPSRRGENKPKSVGNVVDNRKGKSKSNLNRKIAEYQIELLEDDLKEAITLGTAECSEYIEGIRKRLEAWKSLIGGE